MNTIALKLNRANALLLYYRLLYYRLCNIYFAILDSHLSYSCVVWAQSINTVSRLIIYSSKESTTNN